MPVIPATWEAEAGESLEPRIVGGRGCSEGDCTIVVQPGGNKSETPSPPPHQKKKANN